MYSDDYFADAVFPSYFPPDASTDPPPGPGPAAVGMYRFSYIIND